MAHILHLLNWRVAVEVLGDLHQIPAPSVIPDSQGSFKSAGLSIKDGPNYIRIDRRGMNVSRGTVSILVGLIPIWHTHTFYNRFIAWPL